MEIRLSHDQPPVLTDVDEMDRFGVVVEGGFDDDALRAALALVGVPSDDLAHVYVEQDWVRDQALPTTANPGWASAWQAVVGYAHGKGWTDAEGRVRAHVERRSATRVTP